MAREFEVSQTVMFWRTIEADSEEHAKDIMKDEYPLPEFPTLAKSGWNHDIIETEVSALSARGDWDEPKVERRD